MITLDWKNHGMVLWADHAGGRYEVWPTGQARWEAYFIVSREDETYLGATTSPDTAQQQCLNHAKKAARKKKTVKKEVTT